MNEKQMKKAMQFVDKLIAKAKAERDKKGYRENLGYDMYHKLSDFLSPLSLSYQDECKVKDYFHAECDKI